MRKERFEAITDAILAIIATLMLLEIKLGDLSDGSIHRFIGQVLIYIVSFTYIAILWLNHHNMFRHVESVDTKTIWINFWLLFSTSLIPLATATLDESFFNQRSHMFFGTVLAAVLLFYSLLEERVYKSTKHKYNDANRKMNWISTLIFVASVPLSCISIYLSSVIFVLVPFSYLLLPNKVK